MCKQESTARVVPRLVLVCCTAVVSGDLKTEGIFKVEASKELVEALADHFYSGKMMLRRGSALFLIFLLTSEIVGGSSVLFLDYKHALAYNHRSWTSFLPCGDVEAH